MVQSDFTVNDTVLYGSHGVCKITDKTIKEFLGEKKEYFILSPLGENMSTIFVPLDNDALFSKMQHILLPDEIYQLINKVPDEEPEWIENDIERKKLYTSVLSSGNREKIIAMIRNLKNHRDIQKEKGKKLHVADEYFLKNAENLLYDEFALVLNIRREQVLPFILKQIEVNRKSQSN